MPFPTGWPPRRSPQSNGAIRFYKTGTATAAFADNAWLFAQEPGCAVFQPLPVVPPGGGVSTGLSPTVVPQWAGGGENDVGSVEAMAWTTMIRVVNLAPNNTVGHLEISFDGTNVHGVVWNSYLHSGVYETTMEMLYERCEAGIAVRGTAPGVAVPFRIEAW